MERLARPRAPVVKAVGLRRCQIEPSLLQRHAVQSAVDVTGQPSSAGVGTAWSSGPPLSSPARCPASLKVTSVHSGAPSSTRPVSPVRDRGVERREGCLLARRTQPEGEEERRLQHATVTDHHHRLVRMLGHDAGQGGAGADQEHRPALPARGEGVEWAAPRGPFSRPGNRVFHSSKLSPSASPGRSSCRSSSVSTGRPRARDDVLSPSPTRAAACSRTAGRPADAGRAVAPPAGRPVADRDR